MGKITVKVVETRREMADFVDVAKQIYRENPYYVPDLDSDIRNMFNPKKNSGLEFCEMCPFVAYDGQGKPVGRIAGIINRKANEKWGTKYVRFGLIEFENCRDVSEALLAAVEEWGRARGMDAVQGPMGICDFDKEGMLVEDFDRMSSLITIYNHPYYPRHMEALGYEKQVDWVQALIEVPRTCPKEYVHAAELVKRIYGLRVKKLTDADVAKRGYGRKVFDLLNKAYAPLFGYADFSPRQADEYVGRYFPMIDKRMLPVVENEEGQMVGVAITMGGLSLALRKSGGRLWPFGWFHLLRALKWKYEDTAELLLIAVHPDYQGLGVNAMFFEDLIPVYNEMGFKYAETGPQLEDNFKELSQWRPLHPALIKRRRCYVKQIVQ